MSAAVDAGRDRGHEAATGGVADDDDAAVVPKAGPAPSLRAAMRTARVEEAERSRAIADTRGVEAARLDVLKDALEPVLAQVPPGIDLFDAAVMPGTHPRLFIDMIGFVEMAHDTRRYRFLQDTLHGRVTLCESERIDTICEAVTAYIARRLIEREKALASIGPVDPVAAAGSARKPGRLRRTARLALEYLGIVALVVLLWVLGHALYQWAMTLHR